MNWWLVLLGQPRSTPTTMSAGQAIIEIIAIMDVWMDGWMDKELKWECSTVQCSCSIALNIYPKTQQQDLFICKRAQLLIVSHERHRCMIYDILYTFMSVRKVVLQSPRGDWIEFSVSCSTWRRKSIKALKGRKDARARSLRLPRPMRLNQAWPNYGPGAICGPLDF